MGQNIIQPEGEGGTPMGPNFSHLWSLCYSCQIW